MYTPQNVDSYQKITLSWGVIEFIGEVGFILEQIFQRGAFL